MEVPREPDIPSQCSSNYFMNYMNDQIGTVRKKPGLMQPGGEVERSKSDLRYIPYSRAQQVLS